MVLVHPVPEVLRRSLVRTHFLDGYLCLALVFLFRIWIVVRAIIFGVAFTVGIVLVFGGATVFVIVATPKEVLKQLRTWGVLIFSAGQFPVTGTL